MVFRDLEDYERNKEPPGNRVIPVRKEKYVLKYNMVIRVPQRSTLLHLTTLIQSLKDNKEHRVQKVLKVILVLKGSKVLKDNKEHKGQQLNKVI